MESVADPVKRRAAVDTFHAANPMGVVADSCLIGHVYKSNHGERSDHPDFASGDASRQTDGRTKVAP